MEPIAALIAACAGGLVLGLLFIWLHRGRPLRPDSDPLANGTPSTDVINFARIRVAGVGGLGLIAMALAVAWAVPRIGQTVAVGFALGVALAVVLITARRRCGAMPSAGRRPGANTTLAIDDPPHLQGEDVSPASPPDSRRTSPSPARAECGLLPPSAHRTTR